ncbi:MAG: [LysW]-aminoadipate kinase [Calditrichaeota bacterium]|nr:[LysW]-aminoadipate kinase [Calditrichota bacterium]
MMIIKIGGGDSVNLQGIIADLSGVSEPFVIVHGANALRDRLAESLNMPKKTVTSVSGYSSVLSDQEALDVMMMAYSGLRNKRIVELCHQHGINAVGLSGLDGKVIQGQRNKGIRVKQNGKVKILRDFSGKPKTVNSRLLELLLNNGYTPILTVPIIDENNRAINSENDDIVALLQSALQAEIVIQLIEAPGFLENPRDPSTLISKIRKEELARREEQVEGRMKRKILALRKLFDRGAAKVIIADGRVEHPVRDALNEKGTVIL